MEEVDFGIGGATVLLVDAIYDEDIFRCELQTANFKAEEGERELDNVVPLHFE